MDRSVAGFDDHAAEELEQRCGAPDNGICDEWHTLVGTLG
jgi:hypothetical protein